MADAPGPAPTDAFRLPGFPAFWTASAVTEFAGYTTTLALQVFVVLTLAGSATDVGLLNAARWAPYLVLGLVVGALVDRRRRRPILVRADLGRVLVFAAIPALWLLGWLTTPVLMALVAVFGLLSLLHDSASQSFLPRLVPSSSLLPANARLDQAGAAAQATGPLAAGALVSAIGAPLAVLANSVAYLLSAVSVSRIRVVEPEPTPRGSAPGLRAEIAEGVRWVYRHRTLAPMALTTHLWFVANAMLGTVLVPFALVELGLTAFQLGIALACAGVGALLGASVSTRLGQRWGAGRVVIACLAAQPFAWTLIALSPDGGGSLSTVVAALAVGQGLFGLAMGAQNANEMAYRQAVTPDALQGRMNTTMRSVNRAMIVVGAPLGGALGDSLGLRPTLWIAIAGLALVAVLLAASPFRHARHGESARDESAQAEDGLG